MINPVASSRSWALTVEAEMLAKAGGAVGQKVKAVYSGGRSPVRLRSHVDTGEACWTDGVLILLKQAGPVGAV